MTISLVDLYDLSNFVVVLNGVARMLEVVVLTTLTAGIKIEFCTQLRGVFTTVITASLNGHPLPKLGIWFPKLDTLDIDLKNRTELQKAA